MTKQFPFPWTAYWKFQLKLMEDLLDTSGTLLKIAKRFKKFCIYAHNKDYENADKSHKKLEEAMFECMEEIEEKKDEEEINEGEYLDRCNVLRDFMRIIKKNKNVYDSRGKISDELFVEIMERYLM